MSVLQRMLKAAKADNVQPFVVTDKALLAKVLVLQQEYELLLAQRAELNMRININYTQRMELWAPLYDDSRYGLVRGNHYSLDIPSGKITPIVPEEANGKT